MGGALTDLLQKKTGRIAFARRIVAAPGMFIAGVFLIPAAITQNAWASILCLAAAFFFLDLAVGPAWAVSMDVGGAFSGTVTSIMNMGGAVVASITPLVFGILFDKGHWTAPFLVVTAVLFLGSLIWTFLIDPENPITEIVPAKP